MVPEMAKKRTREQERLKRARWRARKRKELTGSEQPMTMEQRARHAVNIRWAKVRAERAEGAEA